MQMKETLRAEVLRRIERDFGLQHMAGTNYMRKGKCPAHNCGKKTLYTFHDSPWMLICGRPEKCGHRVHVKELYDDLFNDWSKTAPATAQDPMATASAYLQFARGFRLELIAGWYSQENYWSRDINAGSATVRFPLEKGGYWERLIDRPERFGKQKARFKPGESYKGVWWCPPSLNLVEVEELYIVEGIFDAIALLHHDVPAVSMMSSAPLPEQSLKALKNACHEADKRLPRLVWALDNEPVAKANMRRWAKEARALGFKCEAAVIPQRGAKKVDWNDLHQRWAFIDGDEERAKRIELDMAEARHQGALLLAESAEEKGLLMYEWDERKEFHFTYRSRLYWFNLDMEKYERTARELDGSEHHDDQLLNDKQRRDKALRQSAAVVRIANCYFDALYYMRNEVTDEAWYYFRVERPEAPTIKSTFTAAQIASAPEFKKRLLNVCNGAMFTGTPQQLERMLGYQLDSLKTVNTIDWIGYTREHGVYVFNDLAIAGGKVHKLNEEDFFDVGSLSIKSQSLSPVLHINANLADYDEEWFDLFWRCFGVRGAVVLAWWLGALYAEQIRQLHKSYLFLELIGEAGAGKTTLVELLWKLSGRTEYEGFDPSKATPASRARNFAQVGNRAGGTDRIRARAEGRRAGEALRLGRTQDRLQRPQRPLHRCEEQRQRHPRTAVPRRPADRAEQRRQRLRADPPAPGPCTPDPRAPDPGNQAPRRAPGAHAGRAAQRLHGQGAQARGAGHQAPGRAHLRLRAAAPGPTGHPHRADRQEPRPAAQPGGRPAAGRAA